MKRIIVTTMVAIATALWNVCRAEEHDDVGATDVPIVTISNENMVASMSANGRWRWETLNDSVTIQDLDDFFYVKCWRGYLLPRLKNGNGLTEEDAVLLEEVIKVHNAFVQELTLAVITDMGVTTNGTEVVVSDPVYQRAIQRFHGKNKGVRQSLRAWAEEFKVIPTDAIRYIIGNIDKAVNDAERGGKPFSERHPVLAVFIYGSPLTDSIFEKWAPKRADALEERVMKLKTKPLLLKNKWLNVREVTSEYLHRGRALRQFLKSVKRDQQDTRTAELIRDVLARTAEESLENEHELECMIYDLPLAIFSHRAIGQMRNSKGWFDDDERKMKVVMSEYCQVIAGTEMLRCIRTRYAANSYVNAVNFLKSELSEKQFQNFLQESKLYRINQKEDEDGRQNNELKAF